jgi:uracil-DNA glycosylase
MKTHGFFPFGQPVEEVDQKDRTPKRVFVLGVYASAVHARWVNPEGKDVVKALAVASEPEIFWRGENAESIISKITIPSDLGALLPADSKFNGPSGKALDELILEPLGLNRNSTWLCDLVPYSCVNATQMKAIERSYNPRVEVYSLPKHSVPSLPQPLTDEARRNEILDEIIESKADSLILLGDQPIRWFLSDFDNRWKNLSDFGEPLLNYGILHETSFRGKPIKILPLAHPRQIAKLGSSSDKWFSAHQFWLKNHANMISKGIN